MGDANAETAPVVDDPVFSGGCPLTDGTYSTFASYGCASPCVHPEHATIDLGEAKIVSSVALHDLEIVSSAIDVQLSTDGTSFTTVATVPYDDHSYALYDVVDFVPTSARFVRVSPVAQGYLYRLSELGVF